MTLAAWVFWWFWPVRYDTFSQTIKPAEPLLAFIFVAIVFYSIYACVRHANSYRYKGAHPIALSLLLFVGHVIATTIYHFLVVLRR